ncbi:MAG: sigma-70 family RNA polymerase sigma factor [Planctomycetota bacterium]|nr:sigma-70 family RNA polymerase sigma factor [Planctomycetota bacterium]
MLRSVERMLRVRGHGSHEIEEIIQETHLAAFIEVDRNRIRSIPAFYHCVASLQGVTRRRRAARFRKRFGRQHPLEPHHAVVDPSHSFETEESRESVADAVRRLPANLRRVVALIADGQSCRESAESVGVSERTIQRHWHAAKRALKTRIGE